MCWPCMNSEIDGSCRRIVMRNCPGSARGLRPVIPKMLAPAFYQYSAGLHIFTEYDLLSSHPTSKYN